MKAEIGTGILVLTGCMITHIPFPELAGEVPERPKGTGCKPVGVAFGGSNPPLSTMISPEKSLLRSDILLPDFGVRE